MPAHHDRDFAQGQGAPDIFMNILTTNGYVSRFVTDWAGPNAILKRVAIRLGAPNYPYDKMTLTGEVKSKQVIDGEGIVELFVRGANGLGDHVKDSQLVPVHGPTLTRIAIDGNRRRRSRPRPAGAYSAACAVSRSATNFSASSGSVRS